MTVDNDKYLDNDIQYAEVALPLPLDLQRYVAAPTEHRPQPTYTYIIPSHFSALAQVGCRVIAPFGNSTREGVIVSRPSKPNLPDASIQLKKITDCLDEKPTFSSSMLQLTHWMAEYYLSSWGEALMATVPGAVRSQQKQTYKLKAGPEAVAGFGSRAKLQRQILDLLQEEGKLTRTQISRRLRKAESALRTPLAKLLGQDLIMVMAKIRPKSQTQYETVIDLAQPLEVTQAEAQQLKNAPKQVEVLKFLTNQEVNLPILQSLLTRRVRCNLSTLRSLEKKELIRLRSQQIVRNPLSLESVPTTEPLKLNEAQAHALTAINRVIEDGLVTTFLLHGVTGSGKTEVYMQAITKILSLGRSAIVLVPEISLTPQTVSRFVGRFGQQVAVLHSRLSDGERYDQWQRIREGKTQIVVGARSAVFAPLNNLGLIVIDEEHETSYKQETSPRYNAREVAIKRAEIQGCVVILGSATPSLESYYRAEQQTYQLLSIPNRVSTIEMPTVKVVDMRRELERGNRTIFSKPMHSGIVDRLQKREQVILFLNRRGHSSYVFCRECGYVERCQDCDVSMTFHFDSKQLLCHHCAQERPTVDQCPACGSSYIRYFGLGTEKVEQEVIKTFPHARVKRMDADSTSGKDGHQRILDAFREQQIDILIGTQMIAKGLDFPNVTLVGVITADTSLNLPDFRSGERTFNLLTQVGGRSGRSQSGGEVIIQTYLPTHDSIKTAQHHDYVGFYQREIGYRQDLRYPPFTYVATVLLRGLEEKEVIETAHYLSEVFIRFQSDAFPKIEIRGPVPAPLSKIKNRYRWHFLLRHTDNRKLRDYLKQTLSHYAGYRPRQIDLIVDIDPVSTL